MKKGELKGKLKKSLLKEEVWKVSQIKRIERKKIRKKEKPTSFLLPELKVKIIGIGGGGGSIVSEMAPKIKKVNFITTDTDFQALKKVGKRAKHFQLGFNLTQGLGSGMNPELGEQAAESEKDRIKELLKETDFCVLVSCLGGGIGSGASPIFAKILNNLGILTLGIFILPFEFEGEKRAQIAKDSLEKLRSNLNAISIIPNQKIFQLIDKNTPLKEALSVINKTLTESLDGLISLIYSPGLITVDFAGLKTILAGRGRLAYLNTAEIKNLDQFEELTKRVISNPLFPYPIQGAKEILFNIDGGLNLNMSQVEQIGKTISDSINPKARVAFGITQNKKEGIKITLLANGCKWEEWEKGKPKGKPTLVVKIKEKPKKRAKKKLFRLPEVKQPEITQIPLEEPKKVEIRIRRNALEAQKAIEDEEKKILAQEKKWEIPAFLRHKPNQINKEKET